MELHERLKKERDILNYLNLLPRKMLKFSHEDNVSEFVLHALCCQDCFNVDKAAYFVDNPEFDCLRGIAGFSRLEAYPDNHHMWEAPKQFSSHMRVAPFNQQVRAMRTDSLKKSHKSDDIVAHEIAQRLGIVNTGFHSWDSHHGNHGILIFERSPESDEQHAQHFFNSMSLLSFCPLF